MNYLFYDTETGGLLPQKHSLLTAYFAVVNDDFKIIDDLYLQLKPEDPSTIVADPGALEVNGIKIEEHVNDPNTVLYSEGKTQLNDLLVRNKIKGKRNHFTPSGHNIEFDNGFIYEQLMPEEEWRKLVHYHKFDTVTFATILKKAGFFAPTQKISLGNLAELFNIPVIDAHNAKADIIMNIEVAKNMIGMLKEAKLGALSGNTNENILSIIEE